MIDNSQRPDSLIPEVDDAWVHQTLLVRHAAVRKAEIATHKWYESERAGQDIGWERATVRYAIHQSLRRS